MFLRSHLLLKLIITQTLNHTHILQVSGGWAQNVAWKDMQNIPKHCKIGTVYVTRRVGNRSPQTPFSAGSELEPGKREIRTTFRRRKQSCGHHALGVGAAYGRNTNAEVPGALLCPFSSFSLPMSSSPLCIRLSFLPARPADQRQPQAHQKLDYELREVGAMSTDFHTSPLSPWRATSWMGMAFMTV